MSNLRSTESQQGDAGTPRTARIADLVKPGEKCRLEHPICGSVDWVERTPGEGFMLVWATGREKGRPLVVDKTVLFDDQWSLENEPTKEAP